MISQIKSRVCGSSPVVGSSKIRSSGRCSKALAISILLLCPPDSFPTGRFRYLRNQKSPPVPAIFFKRFSCYSIKRCSVFQIFPDGKWLVQHTVLKYHAKHCSNFPSDLIQICALDLNRSAVFAKLPADDRNRCALPCPVYTKECKELSFFSPENSDH